MQPHASQSEASERAMSGAAWGIRASSELGIGISNRDPADEFKRVDPWFRHAVEHGFDAAGRGP
jgi:hypothetical protein